MMRSLLAAFTTLLLSVALSAAPKDAEAYYIKLTREYSLSFDGIISEHIVKEIFLNSQYSVNKVREESVLVYNPESQDLVVNSAFVKLPDGSTKLSKDEISENGSHIIPFADAAPGLSIVLDYTIVTKKNSLSELKYTIPLEESFPINELSVEVTIPSDKKLDWQFSASSTIPVETESNGEKHYLWNMKNVPQRSYDKGEFTRPELHFTTGNLGSAGNEITTTLVRKNSFSVDLSFGKEALKYGYAVITLPFEENSFTGAPFATYPSRSHELNIGKPINEHYRYTIELKDGLLVSGFDKLNKEISNNVGYYSFKAEMNGNTLIVERSLEIYESLIPVVDFEEFQNLMSTWAWDNHIQLTTRIADGITSTTTGVRPPISPSISMKE